MSYNRRYLFLIFAAIVLVVGLVNYVVLVYSQASIIEHEAIRIAEVTTSQAVASRTTYSAIADKLKKDGFGPHANFESNSGFVPLPARFLKLVAVEAEKESRGLYTYGPLSKWNLDPAQGLKDDFQRWAWTQLEKQDQSDPKGPIAWQPAWRFEVVNGVRTLRYMRADAASNMSCVNCHGAHEKSPETLARRIAAGVASGKQWKQHQLLGAIEANVPVDKVETIANDQARMILAFGLITSLGGFSFAGWLALRDVRRERKAAAYFREQAKFDPLTRLGNRTLFDERGKTALVNARRSGSRIGVMFIDLDHFKQINDRFGHQIGDRVLYEVGERLVECLRDTDLITRQGGDEFLVLLEGAPHSPNFESVAQKLLDALEAPFEANQEKVYVGASIGISCAPEHGATLDMLIEKADLAMYRAKRMGRSAYLMWTESFKTPPV
ncbi:MAG: hypothetical protein A3I66_08235 [Burkholderiales bacterium RIFCSPLOWO2_02_FULL_57_36]|nr:MAG: hypothetical protein A3I66_08235 [Burkholderiales bacterium RIFCSPLOWO2_02_FULL_57_36]